MAAYARTRDDAGSGPGAPTLPQATADAKATGIRELETASRNIPRARAPRVAYELGNLRYDAQQYAQARGAWDLAVAQGRRGRSGTEPGRHRVHVGVLERNYAKAVEAFKIALTRPGPRRTLLRGSAPGSRADARSWPARRPTRSRLHRRALGELAQSRRVEEITSRLAALGA